MTKVDAVREVLSAYGGKADWGTIYQEIVAHYPQVEKTYNEHAAEMVLTETAKAGIRGVVYREIRNGRCFFKADGVVGLKGTEKKKCGCSLWAWTSQGCLDCQKANHIR